MKKIFHTLSLLFILFGMVSAHAAQVYRFVDKHGVKTISKTLPPYAAQQGYEIVDVTTLRILKRVAPALTDEEIIELNRQKAEEQERQRLADIKAKEEQEQHRQAVLYDANLKANFRTEDELLEKRETELRYFRTQIDKTKTALTRNQNKLYQFQKQAADIELSGQTVSGNLEKRLIAAEQEIQNNEQELERLQKEHTATEEQYDRDLIRLRELLGISS